MRFIENERMKFKHKKAPGGRLAGNRPARVWWMGKKVINNEVNLHSMQYKFLLVRIYKFDPAMAMEDLVLSS